MNLPDTHAAITSLSRVYATVQGRTNAPQTRAFGMWFGAVGTALGVPCAVAQNLALGEQQLAPDVLRDTINSLSTLAMNVVNDDGLSVALYHLDVAAKEATINLAPRPETLVNSPKGTA